MHSKVFNFYTINNIKLFNNFKKFYFSNNKINSIIKVIRNMQLESFLT